MLASFKDFPPRVKAASFTVGDVMEHIATASPERN
jgi:arylsulfatase